MKSFDERIREFPPEFQQEVESLLQLLKARMMREATPPAVTYLDCDTDSKWRGALKEMAEEYSSVDLQHKALDWWNE